MDYRKLNVSKERENEETATINKVKESIKNYDSFVYDAGAGAGKTYALKEALIFAIKTYGKVFEIHNQKILCITYTNVAANEIKNRLGNTNIVLVSTIHERVWEIIKKYKKELFIIHKENLENKVTEINDFIQNNNNAAWYRALGDKKLTIFNKVKEQKLDYYKCYNLGADNYRKNFVKPYLGINISSVSNFRETMDKLFELENYIEALQKMEKKDGIQIKYNIKYNKDRLHRFEISHDTLLDYANKMINRYNMLQCVLIDKFPIVLIDEFQDTNKKIIDFVVKIREKALDIKHDFCIGFFGDIKQNIYDDGIGSEFYDFVKNFTLIRNGFNRRSPEEIVKIANNVRSDSIEQESIYENFHAKDCYFSNKIFDDTEQKEIIKKWQISKLNKLHCFVLKNEIVAAKNGFRKVYDAFRQCYQGAKFDQLNTELFSDDEFKLGEIQLLIKRIAMFKVSLNDRKTIINTIINLREKAYNLIKLEDILKKYDLIKGDTLIQYLESFMSVLKDNKDEIQYILSDEITDVNAFKNKIVQVLFQHVDEPQIDSILDLPMEEIVNWYYYVTMNYGEKEIVYQTIHNAKGLQYDNVVILLDDNFARDRNYFKRFFINYSKETDLKNQNYNEYIKYCKAQNLLYVAITRAINNLAVYYDLKDDDPAMDKIKSIFNQQIQNDK